MAPSSTASLDTYVETRMIGIGQLVHFPGNARRGNVGELRKSLRRHGQYRALIVNDDGASEYFTIVAGNHTYDGLVANGAREVRCEVHRMDADLARRVNVADNAQADLGTTDEAALLAQLSQMDGDFEGLGVGQDDIDAMLAHDVLPVDDGPAPLPRPRPKPDPEPEPDGEDVGDDEEPAEAPKNRGLGKPVIGYQLVFDNEVQQTAWFEFLRSLKGRYRDLETIGERLHAYLGSLDQ